MREAKNRSVLNVPSPYLENKYWLMDKTHNYKNYINNIS